MDIIGKVVKVKENEHGTEIAVKQHNSVFTISGKELGGIQKDSSISITNISKRAGFLKTIYSLTDKSTIAIYPDVYITPSEISLAKYCRYTPLMNQLYVGELKNNREELTFYRGMRGEDLPDKAAKIAKRYPKELKGKFSYKSMQFSKKFGVFFQDILHFGKFPVVFKGNRIKGILLAADSNTGKYILINKENSTMDERNVDYKELKDILNLRNSIVKMHFADKYDDFWEIMSSSCVETCPAKNLCSKIALKKNKNAEFEKFFSSYLKQDLKTRKSFLKTVLHEENPIRGSIKAYLKKKTKEDSKIFYNLRIPANEAWIAKGEEVLTVENPPLNRKMFATVEQVNFSNMIIKSENDILKPELVAPIDTQLPVYRGIYDFLYSENSPEKFFTSALSEVAPFQTETYIPNDAVQNEAVNKLLNFKGLFSITGESGSGKKYTIKKAVSRFVKRGNKILIACESRKNEMNNIIADELKVFTGKEKLIHIYGMNEKDLYLENPDFDYAIITIDSTTIDTKILKAIAGKAKNVVFLATEFVPFGDRIPETNRIKLKSEHRFGEHIQHFLQPILSDVSPMPDREITVKNSENVSNEFKEIVSPDKFVQFVFIKDTPKGENNKWNEAEATFTLLLTQEFIKAGADKEKISVITQYERQKSYIEELFEDSHISEVKTTLPEDSYENDIIIISFVDLKRINGLFTDPTKLKIALTRARSKLILVGSKNITKTNKILSKIV